jgi:ATP-binding cassette subfamily B protein
MQKPYPTSLLKFFLQMIAPQKWKFIILFISMFAWTMQEALYPYFFKLIMDRVSEFSGPISGVFAHVTPVLIIYVCTWLLVELGFRTHDFLSAFTYPDFKNRVRSTMYSYALGHSHNYFAENFAGTISSKINRMADAMERIMEQFISLFIPLTAAFLLSAAFLYSAKPVFGIGMMVWLVIHLSITVYFTRKAEKYSERVSEANTALSGRIVDSFTNIINVRLFSRFKYEKEALNEYQQEVKDRTKKLMLYNSWMKALLGVCSNIFQFAMVIGGIYFYSKGLITLGDFVLIMSVVPLFGLAWYLGFNIIEFFNHVGTCREALTLLTRAHDVQDTPNAKEISITKGEIEFENVSFHYIPGKNIFSDRTIHIQAGEKVGLVGFSGSGKSTFVNLILRYFDIESGHILIDGQNIAEVTQSSLRDGIAIIPQDTTLFHRSLMENIRYGRLNATDEEVYAAAKLANAHEFIMQVEGKYDALVGERGIKLSGGQRQRIAIARAILKNSPILILDEATSALDSVTEREIQASLKNLMQNKTSIVIAHRLSTLLDMDRILVFENGKIIEHGTHAELLGQGGHYAKLWQMQAGGFLDEKAL